MGSRSIALCMLVLAAGCGAPDPPGSTGGTGVTPGECGRGLVVVSADDGYQSTNVSLVGMDGQVLSSSFISSATTGAGLSAPLSGDVVAPTPPLAGSSVVLIDRTVSVLTWVDIQSAHVTGQVAVGAKTNPHDYLELGSGKAYVSRFGRKAGVGGDIAVVDPQRLEIIGTIDLGSAMAGEPPEFLPSPSRILRVGSRVVVTLLGFPAGDFQQSARSRLVLLDPETDSIESLLVLDGLYECNGLAASPWAEQVAVSCSGRFNGGSDPVLAESALVVVDLDPSPKEIARIAAVDAPFGFAVAYAGPHTLVANTFGSFGDGSSPERSDTALQVDLETGVRREVLRAKAFALGDVRCAAPCKACFVTDAESAVLDRFDLGAGGELSGPTAITVDSAIGLPPRTLGQF